MKKLWEYITNNFKKIRWNSLWVLNASVTVLLTVVAVVVIVFLMNSRYNEHLYESTTKSNQQVVDSVVTSIDSYIVDMMEISDSLQSVAEAQDERKTSYHFLREDINTIAIFDLQGNPVLKTTNLPIAETVSVTKQDWFTKVIPGSKVYQLSSPHVQRLYPREYPWVISLSGWIEWEDDDKINQGVMLVDLNFKTIRELCNKELGNNGYLYIIDENGDIVYHPHQQMIYAGLAQEELETVSQLSQGTHIVNSGEENLSVTIQPLKFKWRVVGVSPVKNMLSYDYQIKNFIVFTLIVIVLATVVLATFLALMITRPLRGLTDLMEDVESGDLDAFSKIQGVHEVEELSDSFNQMVYRIKQLMEQVQAEQQQLRKSEMETLYSQINPHFLYNTLDSILWMAEAEDNQGVVKMIDALAKFFRLSISGGKDIVPVIKELQHAESYLVIQKMRYSDQFTYDINWEPEVKDLKTLKILLQPIIENAVIHGVGNLPYPGEIKISAYTDGENLFYTVTDNGFGMTEETISNLFSGTASGKSGIGLFNVQSRIHLLFGQEYGISIESELDEGTKVTFKLPIIKEEDYNENHN